MTIAIRYYSRSGNTKKLAEAISAATGAPAQTVDTPLHEPVDILFLGSAVYAGGVDDRVKAFIASLDADKIKRVVNFSTAAILSSTYAQIKKLLAAKNIPLDEHEFHCRGRFAVVHAGRPNRKDLDAVQAFAKAIVGSE